MRQIEEFAVTTNGITDYIGYLYLEDVADNDPFKAALSQGAWKTTINEKELVRCGMYQRNLGTLLTLEQFQPYFKAYGDLMLTFKEYAAEVAKYSASEETL